MIHARLFFLFLASVAVWLPVSSFTSLASNSRRTLVASQSWATIQSSDNNNNDYDHDSSAPMNHQRRAFVYQSLTAAAAAATLAPATAQAQVFLDPAMYGDQELRVSAVDSVKERVRRAILQDPALAPSFYQLAVLDGISYNAQTSEYGPNGAILAAVLSSSSSNKQQAEGSAYMTNLQKAAVALAEAERFLRKKNAVSVADCIAIGGAEAIESIGGPVLPVQLGRADTPSTARTNPSMPLTLLSGTVPPATVAAAFAGAGLTERELTAILTALFTLETVEKTRSVDDWKASGKPKFREAGKMGRMNEFRRLTDEDIAEAEADAELAAELEDPDDGWYIADSFGTRESRFGQRIATEDISEKNFNKYVQTLDSALRGKDKSAVAELGWVATVLSELPTAPQWVSKYASSNLNYKKDLGVAYNSVTQLGAVYTGGKYESLLKGKPRKTLNDDGLNLF